MKFPESAHAHRWLDGLKGVEVGGSAHNPFGIEGCVNVDYTDSADTIFKDEEFRQCGERLKVDVVDEGETLATFADDSLDYILSSHVFEHFADPVGALLNWRRVLKDGGVIYMIVPQRDALAEDACRPLTSIEHVWADFINEETWDTHPLAPGHGPRGHYHVYSPDSLRVIVGLAAEWLFDSGITPGDVEPWDVVDLLKVDDKVHNGFTLVLRVKK